MESVNARVNVLFDVEVKKRKDFLEREMGIKINGTSLTFQMGRMMKENKLFPMNKDLLNNMVGKRNRKKFTWEMEL